MVFYNDTIFKLYGWHGREGDEEICMSMSLKLNNVQKEMRKKYKISFQFRLIGSGKRHLVTRIQGGNRGYDFDYNLIIQPPECQPNVLKQRFMDAFKIALKGTQYSFPKDSTSAITIKVIDNYENNGYYYLKNNKKSGTYEFAFRALKFDIDEKAHDIINGNGWPYIKDEYRLLKNINEGNGKHSFSLYAEAVNNVYNQMFYSKL